MVRELNPQFYKQTGHFPDFFKTMAEAFFFLLPQAVLVYPLLYFILPRFVFTGKYLKASLWIVIFLFLALFASAALLIFVPWHKVAWLTSQKELFQGASPTTQWMLAYLSALQGGLTAAALAASFKMFKHYYVKNLRNIQLQQENAKAQLQLLTAQVHPHFLFNTLNNIYSQTQTESPRGSKMIMELSDLLRYILAEGNKRIVPLEKELAMIKNYMNLEKIRYGNNLDLHVSMPDTTGDLQIAPLLLLPFVENCFKHGASKFLKAPWVNLKIEVVDRSLIMKLMNGKDLHRSKNVVKSSTGINNVKKRLDLLYPGEYDLEITDEPEVFVINLKLTLTNKTEQVPVVENTLLQPAYA
jgi:sensor histidine kinase YesM